MGELLRMMIRSSTQKSPRQKSPVAEIFPCTARQSQGVEFRPVAQDQTLPIAKDWGISIESVWAQTFSHTIVTSAELLRL